MAKIAKLKFYSKANCQQCSASARHLKTLGVADTEGVGINVTPVSLENNLPIEVYKVDKDPEALARIKELGFVAAPVLLFESAGGEIVASATGFDPSSITAGVEAYRG